MFISSLAYAELPRFIIGGHTTPSSSHIAHSTVALIAQSSQGQSLCTASVVANDLAVTAAHCVSDGAARLQNMTLYFTTRLTQVSEAQTREVDHIAVHPSWSPGRAVNTADVAVLHFNGGLPQGYMPAALLPFDAELAAGESVEIAGYGISDAQNDAGSGVLRQIELKIANPRFSETEVELDQSHGGGACHGDSGGPAYVVIAGQPYLFGITSRGSGDCDVDVIYTRIAAYGDWFGDASRALRR